nr:immunoglobulin light chain junction region [Macaca mulatta]MOW31043.1 immunoglobulin light chain junction region [Macaca mulatta]MOW31077.1 immunoglobulin light chain junction region [Macaca mulatta]MOW31079.1 immunoglobulin light chain junction region [Macaca mulatta]MOW31112.1 immunoglobulin light chain junction region [Macaca mulatta]
DYSCQVFDSSDNIIF